MADPRLLLAERLTAAVAAAFGPDFAGTDPMVRRSERADYQADLAMGLAKQLKRAPRQVAEAVVANLDVADVCERVEIAGPGFINLTLAKRFVEREAAALASDRTLGVPRAAKRERVVVDYSAPNVAKEMHVGHLRSTIIGDALARLLEAVGHEVIRQNHLGDWGTPFGMLIEHLVDLGGADARARSDLGELGDFYRAARVKFDGDPAFADRARRRVVQLQAGDAGTLALWQTLIDITKQHLADTYGKLGVQLVDADIRGESFYNAMLADVAGDLERRGIASINDGALCVFPPGFANRDGEPLPLIVRKQDGGYGYAATDLAALRFRTGTLHATRLLYVVGSPQAQHLAMVFAVAAIAGWLAPPVRAEHVAFGQVLGQDKKILKSRAGEVVRLVDLLDEAIERADAELAKRDVERGVARDAAERRALAPAIGIGAVKYADLANDRIKDYVFDWERMLAPEGRTGPYLQYAHARIRSIFRKAAEEGIAPPAAGTRIALAEPAERALGLELLGFGAAVLESAETLKPHRLAGYLYDLATAFTAFFESCPVLRAPDAAARDSRLALCALTADVLARGLDLLGIEAPERM
ncbi:MAG TPA: arginine--tRNA ligase [Gammaproteobacteria bacterium]|nr:arginine--tRNA ligase [Gammaproteobacteria bacterium]